METRNFLKELQILHVEDDAVESMNLARIFRKLGVRHQVHTATNGEEALRSLRSPTKPRPHLILLDLHMPLMDGGEFLAALRAESDFLEIMVYVLTSSDLPQDKAIAAHFGVASYSVKPFTPEKYNEVILQLLTQWESLEFTV